MDFVTVVDEAIALLRQRGRLTYRTLQWQFQLDDAHLVALKDEIIKYERMRPRHAVGHAKIATLVGRLCGIPVRTHANRFPWSMPS